MTNPIEKTVSVPLSPAQAFDLFTNRTASWWPLDKHSLSAGDGKVARDLIIEPRVGGAITETKHDGTLANWGKVLAWQPGTSFAISWQLDRPEDEVTRLDISFAPEGSGTRVTLLHSGWDSIPEEARAARTHYATGWDLVLCERFKTAAR